MQNLPKARLQLIITMIIFGTVGIFKSYITLPAGMIALARGAIGALFLLAILLFGKRKPNLSAIRKNLPLLVVSGGCIGLNWALLFKAIDLSSVPTATLCYYMAPLFVVTASPIVLKERLTVKKTACVLVALCGMVFVSGCFREGLPTQNKALGILCGLGAAILYAAVIFMNKKITDITANDKTIIQLAAAAAVMVPYCCLFESREQYVFSAQNSILTLILGILHTGIAYVLYFGALKKLPAQTTAILSYTDPVVALLLSTVIALLSGTALPDIYTFIGAVFILGASVCSETTFRKKGKGDLQYENEV